MRPSRQKRNVAHFGSSVANDLVSVACHVKSTGTSVGEAKGAEIVFVQVFFGKDGRLVRKVRRSKFITLGDFDV